MTTPPHTRPGPNTSPRVQSRRLTLRDGRVVDVRPLERGDRQGLAAAVRRLSDQTRYLRFATAKPRLTKRELDFLVDVDHHRHEAIVAIDPTTRPRSRRPLPTTGKDAGSAQHCSRSSPDVPATRGTRRSAPASSLPTNAQSGCCSQPASRRSGAAASSASTSSHSLSRPPQHAALTGTRSSCQAEWVRERGQARLPDDWRNRCPDLEVESRR